MVANGAVAITFESQVDEVVLEPAPGEIPLWERIRLLALFPVGVSISGLNDALRALDPDIHERLDVAFIAEEDWQNVWRTIQFVQNLAAVCGCYRNTNPIGMPVQLRC